MLGHPISCGRAGNKSGNHPNERDEKNAPNKTSLYFCPIWYLCTGLAGNESLCSGILGFSNPD